MSPPIVARVIAFQNAYMHVFAALAAFIIVLVTVITSAEVFNRYVLDHSLVWAEEACRSLLIWMCFLFAGAAFQRGEMIAVGMLTAALGRRTRALVIVPGYIVTTIFLAAMVYYGWIYAEQNLTQTVPGLEALWMQITGVDRVFPIFWVYLALPVGFGILLVHMAASTLRYVIEAFVPPSEER
jgi:TRAP-type C4-dicarboxylate transport system permease small subunit